MLTWCKVYGRGSITDAQVEMVIENLTVVVKLLQEENAKLANQQRSSVTESLHGQRTEPRVEEEAETSKRRKKRKAPTVEVQKQPSLEFLTAQEATGEPSQQLEIKYLTWLELIPDGHIHLDYKDRWKIFEDGLDKDC
eukprot:Gb_13538 [translate_table: standard]